MITLFRCTERTLPETRKARISMTLLFLARVYSAAKQTDTFRRNLRDVCVKREVSEAPQRFRSPSSSQIGI